MTDHQDLVVSLGLADHEALVEWAAEVGVSTAELAARLLTRYKPAVPEKARACAAHLASLFDHDRKLAIALNEAQRRLLDANDRLTAGLSAEALRAVYGPAGPDLGLSGQRPPVLEEGESPIAALETIAATIRDAFTDYQDAGEQRRQLAFDIGEANARLAAVMTAAGFSADDARRADIAALAEGVFRCVQEAR